MAETAAKVEVEEPVILGRVAIAPVVPTRLEHHRSLPPGHYNLILGNGRTGTVNVLRVSHTITLYVVLWVAVGRRLLNEFEVTEDGAVINEEGVLGGHE
ncbi:MAG: hypothetical protein AAB759_00950 [Patescibacteria group bacterium]